MKHIKLFESFLLEGTGLVTGKYDIDRLVDFLIKIPMTEATDGIAAAVIQTKGTYGDREIFICLRGKSAQASGLSSYHTRTITIHSFPGQDIYQMRMVLSHELSHMLDIGVKIIDTKYPDHMFDINLNLKRLSKEALFKKYISDETEREAWSSGLVYVINSLLIEHPEKIEAVKELIRKKDWHIEKVFPEIQNIINDLSDVFSSYGKIRERFFKRLAAAIITHKKGEMIDIKAVIVDDSDDERRIRVKPIKPEGYSGFSGYYTGSYEPTPEVKKYEKDLSLYNDGIETIERNKLVKKAADEMNIETVTFESKILWDILLR
jgi:hypothetical protein